eukprot:gene12435-12572_t
MSSIISYLENYVESTLGLPSDLARFLNTIKVLDERASELVEAIKHTTEALCSLPPVHTCKGTPTEQEYHELVATFKRQEALLYQFSEEKVQLAQHALELITQYQKQLDETTQQFEEEVANVPQAAPESFNPFEQPYSAAGGRGKGKGFADQWDSLEPLAAPTLKRVMTHTGDTGPRNLRERLVDMLTVPTWCAVFTQHIHNVLEGGDNPMFPPVQFMNHERTAGLMDSAQQPQLPGRLLQISDIKADLQGRQAEMYWPDDNMWYLIEIHRVNVIDKTATIVYRTGEVEELNLQEIANEGHMSLIEPM